MENNYKIEMSKNVPSFEIKSLKNKYHIADIDMEALLKIIPPEVSDTEKHNYLEVICQWFSEGISLEIIKEYLLKFAKEFTKNILEKYSVGFYPSFSDFKDIVDFKPSIITKIINIIFSIFKK